MIGVPAGTLIGRIAPKPNYTYRLNERNRFVGFDPESGEIRTIDEIDRERIVTNDADKASIQLLIVGSPACLITVSIRIDDINDNSPSFPFAIQNIRIVESAVAGSRLVLHSASDPDYGDNGTIIDYHIIVDNSSISSNLFQLVHSMNPDGDDVILLEIIGQLDREQRSLHTLNISATDSGTPSRSGFVTVNVNVLDANDNAPIFNESHYEITISESSTIDTRIVYVNATDADTDVNAQISYSISNDLKSQFHIDAISGLITTKVSIYHSSHV